MKASVNEPLVFEDKTARREIVVDGLVRALLGAPECADEGDDLVTSCSHGCDDDDGV